MSLLVTSNGITNETIARSLECMVGKPREETSIVFYPDAALAFLSEADEWPDDLNRNINHLDKYSRKLTVSRLAGKTNTEIMAEIADADVVSLGGGNTNYLSYLMQKTGMFDQVPDIIKSKTLLTISAGGVMLSETVGVTSTALTAGTPGTVDLEGLGPKGKSSSRTLKILPLLLRPHFNAPWRPIPEETMQQAADFYGLPLYAIDDSTALEVEGGSIKVVSEGEWKIFQPE